MGMMDFMYPGRGTELGEVDDILRPDAGFEAGPRELQGVARPRVHGLQGEDLLVGGEVDGRGAAPGGGDPRRVGGLPRLAGAPGARGGSGRGTGQACVARPVRGVLGRPHAARRPRADPLQVRCRATAREPRRHLPGCTARPTPAWPYWSSHSTSTRKRPLFRHRVVSSGMQSVGDPSRR